MHQLRLLYALSALGALGGCAAVDSVNQYIERADQKKEEELVLMARSACERYGFKVSSDSFAQCIQTEVNNMKTREAISEAARRSEPIVPTAPVVPSAPTTTTCTKTLLGMECTSR